MSKENRLVPELRFPEFDEKYSSDNLGNVSDVRDGTHDSPKYVKSGYPLITSKNLIGGKIDFDNVNLISSDEFEKINRRSKVDVGDIIFAMIGTIGNPVLCVNNKFAIKNVALIKQKKALLNEYLIYWLQSNSFKKHIRNYNAGGTQKFLSLGIIRNLFIHYPGIEEQQKIATFLSLIDKKIELLEKKVELLEEQKRGLLQKIFSQEIRFRKDDGSEFRKWKIVKLGSIGEFKTSSVDKKNYSNQKEVFLINYMDVYRHKKIAGDNLDDLMKVTASEQEIRSSSVVKGDVLFTPSSETPDDIGHSEVISENFANVLYSYHLVRFRPSIEFNNLFLSYVFNTRNVFKQFANLSQGATRYTLSKNSFENVEVVFPTELEEQEKIAVLLRYNDHLINNTKSKLEKINDLKKGLLQKMFI